MKPNGKIMILYKLTLHSQYFNLMQLLNVKTHFVNLLEAILFLIVFDKLFIIAKLPEVIIHSRWYIIRVNWREEFDNYWSSTANRSLNVCLDAVYGLPEIIISSLVQDPT